jgi:hypothetical protein
MVLRRPGALNGVELVVPVLPNVQFGSGDDERRIIRISQRLGSPHTGSEV